MMECAIMVNNQSMAVDYSPITACPELFIPLTPPTLVKD